MVYTYQRGIKREPRIIAMIAGAGAALLAAVGLILANVAMVFAQPTGTYSLSGEASQQADGIHLTSDATTASSVEFDLEPGTTVNDLGSLEATLTKVTGNCGGGAPRFSVETASGNIFVYVGDAPNFTNCADGTTGDLLASPDLRVDTSQVGGTFYDTWTNAQALVGSEEVTGLSFVVDAGWQGNQEFVLSSATVNTTSFNFVEAVAPTAKEECKNGGWMNFQTSYKNQGQCVAAVVSNENSKHNR